MNATTEDYLPKIAERSPLELIQTLVELRRHATVDKKHLPHVRVALRSGEQITGELRAFSGTEPTTSHTVIIDQDGNLHLFYTQDVVALSVLKRYGGGAQQSRILRALSGDNETTLPGPKNRRTPTLLEDDPVIDLDRFSLSRSNLLALDWAMSQRGALLIVAGEARSGKSTFVRASLNRFRRRPESSSAMIRILTTNTNARAYSGMLAPEHTTLFNVSPDQKNPIPFPAYETLAASDLLVVDPSDFTIDGCWGFIAVNGALQGGVAICTLTGSTDAAHTELFHQCPPTQVNRLTKGTPIVSIYVKPHWCDSSVGRPTVTDPIAQQAREIARGLATSGISNPLYIIWTSTGLLQSLRSIALSDAHEWEMATQSHATLPTNERDFVGRSLAAYISSISEREAWPTPASPEWLDTVCVCIREIVDEFHLPFSKASLVTATQTLAQASTNDTTNPALWKSLNDSDRTAMVRFLNERVIAAGNRQQVFDDFEKLSSTKKDQICSYLRTPGLYYQVEVTVSIVSEANHLEIVP